GSDEESQALIDCNILDILNKFLNDPNKCAQACTTISKLTAGNSGQIARIMNMGIMTKLIRIITSPVYDIAAWKEAAWAVANALDGRRSPEQFTVLISDGAVEPICEMLAKYSQDFALHGDEGVLKSETIYRLLRCLDQVT